MIEIGLGHYLSLGAIIFFLPFNWSFFKQEKCDSYIDVY